MFVHRIENGYCVSTVISRKECVLASDMVPARSLDSLEGASPIPEEKPETHQEEQQIEAGAEEVGETPLAQANSDQ